MKKVQLISYTLILAILSMFLASKDVSATTYTSNTNLFETTYSNNLIDMAHTQVDNFINKNFVIVQYDYNYYLVVSKDYSVSGNTITFTDAQVFSAIRIQSGYSSYYEYYSTHEASSIVNANNISISNIDFANAISSKRFNEYRTDFYSIAIFTIILGLVFAIFLTRERSF